MTVPYRRPGIRLTRGVSADPELVPALPRDLRSLGYLRGGLDGRFGLQTERAVRSIHHYQVQVRRRLLHPPRL